MDNKKRLLFVCTANQQRSPTAEQMYQNDPRFEVRSAGTRAFLGNEVTADALEWADLVVVMEDRHARSIQRAFPREAETADLIVLDIPDVYQFMDLRLQKEIRERLEPILRQRYS